MGVEADKIAGDDSMKIFAMGGFEPERPRLSVMFARSVDPGETKGATDVFEATLLDEDGSARDGRRESGSK